MGYPRNELIGSEPTEFGSSTMQATASACSRQATTRPRPSTASSTLASARVRRVNSTLRDDALGVCLLELGHHRRPEPVRDYCLLETDVLVSVLLSERNQLRHGLACIPQRRRSTVHEHQYVAPLSRFLELSLS